ncbi:hypothetical protein A3K48_06240 [candidate division WOR-1 bacterium RIFOXYA12_FULL_52_29]|uniref:Uncharacterized protein n=1 Tax=candidate division WOR-1 bacterium RIFOXYC12_FULL_54_18 TaxID=1802584 RepID=A0A1F4T7M1_UNCSA|nr:MAG: hypothetical protein A3K44_06240 [candidate division WOR-1 bacterium RIFOXYA2_FULL_51_19]OGC18130.1 MAG: hypothetical protein A3K48_06240 [candidate division WOR-1 bacterium RIFOXYA12_FULL_52_29]OGC26985.1 MAG: hypothetical protein A3K32_06235 [candidate division WOR-1 bacterium RIFOXYB2_FULL_45_9]OGC28547.1 MAG: hypothetical protein A3K49_06240 [candidate division WOR-1 bacterium RIFOXYC12_FULL_54_18]OGC30998.1 MAG: hypothetical protein A2346_06380 [candidate division WOR-1 bacterium R
MNQNEERLFEAIEKIRRDKHEPWRYVLFTFVNGIAQGVGFALGTTIVLGLSIYVLTIVIAQLVNFPVVGHYFQQIGTLIDAYSKQPLRVR